MEFLEGGAIEPLKSFLRKYNDDPEKEQPRLNVENEVSRLIDLADANRHQENAGAAVMEEMKESEYVDTSSKYGRLGWLNKLTSLSDDANSDICREPEVTAETIQEGMILDAQDYLGEWHLSVVCKLPQDDDEYAKLNFLRYPKGNGDEWYTR